MLDVGVAKRYLETQMVIFEKTMAPEMKKALTVALDSMAKDIAEKPKISDSRSFHICPRCNKIVRRNEQSHGNLNIPRCKWCGQAWDWSDYE